MTPAETVLLVRYVKAQKAAQAIDEYTPEAWHDALGHLRLADCREAVRRLAVIERWIDPSDIAKTVKTIRHERIIAAGDTPLPPELGVDPDDAVGYRDALREWRRHAADGDVAPAIAALQQPAPRDVRRAIAGTFRSVPG